MNKTLYISDKDEEVWRRAKDLAPVSLSVLITELLREYVSEAESKARESLNSEMAT